VKETQRPSLKKNLTCQYYACFIVELSLVHCHQGLWEKFYPEIRRSTAVPWLQWQLSKLV